MHKKTIGTVLSLFDGDAGGRLALDRANMKFDNYYASEIDKYAMQIAQKNWNDVQEIGDVTGVTGVGLGKIDLLIGGSPCQGFSVAGKQLNFEDLRSKLFFEYVRLLDKTNPKYFMLENVAMKQEFQDIISGYLGVQPIKINSSLVSAQNRKRLYWTNIPGVTQPEDRHIYLKDVLEDGSYATCGAWRGRYVIDGKRQDGKMKTAGLTTQRLELRKDKKTNTLTAVQKDNVVVYPLKEYYADKDIKSPVDHCIKIGEADYPGNFSSIKRVYSEQGKCPTLTSMGGGNREPKVIVRDLQFDKEPSLPDEKYKTCKTINYKDDKFRALRASGGGKTQGIGICNDKGLWRKLTPLECERLQTMPDNYTAGVSNTQRYKMLGNGWTADVIAHILSFIPDNC